MTQLSRDTIARIARLTIENLPAYDPESWDSLSDGARVPYEAEALRREITPEQAYAQHIAETRVVQLEDANARRAATQIRDAIQGTVTR